MVRKFYFSSDKLERSFMHMCKADAWQFGGLKLSLAITEELVTKIMTYECELDVPRLQI